jgi:hypothetical protein
MTTYDQIDKTDWITMELELSDDLITDLKSIAEFEDRELEDLISKMLYEWWQNEIENNNTENNTEVS